MVLQTKNFKIDGTDIGIDAPCYIIAEAGSNHNQNLELALKLIDCAAEANANAVKFQTFSAERIASQFVDKSTKIDFAGAKTLFELYKKTELPRKWQKDLYQYAVSKKITFLSTPFDEEAVDELYNLGVGAFKIASFELCHHPLLRHVAKAQKPVLLSTGMATLGEIEESIAVLNDAGCHQIGLFHCGIDYPLDPRDVNLRAMKTMMRSFDYPIGYSDHTLGVAIPVAAVSLGARMIEKHFTLDKTLPGPDHGFALAPGELKEMVESVRVTEQALGSKVKGPTKSEEAHKKRACRSIFAKVMIPKGTVITEEMVSVLRPAAGLHPKYLEIVVGKKTMRDIQQHEPIQWEMFTDQ
ncbi:MAG: N-acetylneuraminate synthase family protein [Deltaproteobacteria bacterium]|jgi:N-acetylneuraminate synthase/N,N'-diacetyllegionaminate synthase|nr:N-acetylneuraminate synthase family protein [Deltaproteobacteria bacterium]